MNAFLADLPGQIACIIAAATLWLAMAHAEAVTHALGWLP